MNKNITGLCRFYLKFFLWYHELPNYNRYVKTINQQGIIQNDFNQKIQQNLIFFFQNNFILHKHLTSEEWKPKWDREYGTGKYAHDTPKSRFNELGSSDHVCSLNCLIH